MCLPKSFRATTWGRPYSVYDIIKNPKQKADYASALTVFAFFVGFLASVFSTASIPPFTCLPLYDPHDLQA